MQARGENHKLDTYKHLAIALMSSNSLKEANKYLIDGLSEYPQSSTLWGMRAVTKYKLHDHKEAVMAAQRARELDPNKINQYIYRQIVNKKQIKL